ncbi:hypothetical protein PTKIN_Ptkin18bG0072500 [Pterospermum kingtungense]
MEPILVEALATVKALEFAMDMGFRMVVLEGDSIGVVNRFSSSVPDLSIVGVVLAEGKKLIGQFDSCSVMHTLRDGNKAAHALAQLGVG